MATLTLSSCKLQSNEWSGKNSFWGLSLHNIGELPNPYEEAIKVVARTLHSFDEDHLIPCYGFGDGKSHFLFAFLCFSEGLVSNLTLAPVCVYSCRMHFVIVLVAREQYEQSWLYDHLVVCSLVQSRPCCMHGKHGQQNVDNTLFVPAASTHDDHIFSFYPGDRPAQGLEDVQNRYR